MSCAGGIYPGRWGIWGVRADHLGERVDHWAIGIGRDVFFNMETKIIRELLGQEKQQPIKIAGS